MDRHHTTPGRVERMTASELAAALAARAEEVCRRYLPRGLKDGRVLEGGQRPRRRRALRTMSFSAAFAGSWARSPSSENNRPISSSLRVTSKSSSAELDLADRP